MTFLKLQKYIFNNHAHNFMFIQAKRVNKTLHKLDKPIDPSKVQSVKESLLTIREVESSFNRENNKCWAEFS